jgi:GDSL-like lipase/acylhydrolase family protein
VRHPLIAGLAVLVVLAGLLAWVASAPSDSRPRVLLVGDSLVLQAAPYWVPMMQRAGYDVVQLSYAGTNTCDWFDAMRRQRSEFDPDVVAIAFGGNDLTDCMRHADGSQLTRAEFRAKYREDTETALEIWDDDVAVYLVSPPAMFDGDRRFAPTYEAIAASRANVEFVDGGRLLTPCQDWRRTAPCLPDEPECTGPVEHGVATNVVRSPDEVHFCPVPNDAGARCPVYSSGGYRFARTIAEGIRRPA